MRRDPNGLPRQVKCVALLVLTFIAPVSALAQLEPAGSSDGPATQAASGDKPAGGILDMDIEQLTRTPVVVPSMDIPVTSVTKELSTVGRSAAAVFVITPEMIRRSGATCIPDALRTAPGMEVAQINSNTWAISCRGFNSAYSDKLLVLIDGRTVYNPDFAGVFWNVQDVLLEDVERIEVIRGPGGTLWGTNAVDGVINVITKRANDTQGIYAHGGGGSHERDMEAFRYGGVIGEDLHYRVYGKHFERGPNFDPTGLVDDAWRQRRFGFRADWEPGRDKTNFLTVQGDHYVGDTDGGSSGFPLDPTVGEHLTGENLLMRWRHVDDEDSDWSLQVYYDRYLRGSSLQTQSDKTYDIEFQRRFPLADRHSVTWGAGFRSVESLSIGGDQFTTYFPTPYFITNYTNQFIQDEIAVVEDRLALTLGCKLEQDPYTGLEYQPTARMLWTPDRRHSAWAAFSRAVHTPSRGVEQITITLPPYFPGVYPRVIGNNNVRSEAVLAYEIGYREQATKRFSWDIAMFYNAYDHLVSVQPGSPFPEPPPPDPPQRLIVPLSMGNGGRGETYGVELCGNYSVSERWHLYAQYTVLQMHLTADPPETIEQGSDPHNQVYLRSAWNLRHDLEFDLMARYVDSLTAIDVPSYISMDLRFGVAAAETLGTGGSGPEPAARAPLGVRWKYPGIAHLRNGSSSRSLRNRIMALLSNSALQPPPRNRVSSTAPTARAAGWRGTLPAVGRALLFLVAWNVGLAPLAAQENDESTANREYRIKAAYLYQFGRYVEWPAKAFSSPQAPFVVGVLEHDPLIGDLDQIARIKKIQDRPIEIRRFSSAADIRACNILYLPASLAPETQAEVIRKAVGQGVLLVGDSTIFLERGGAVQFAVEDNRIRVVISRKAAERAGLTISAKLLQVARVVD